jgi:hypothetical protein
MTLSQFDIFHKRQVDRALRGESGFRRKLMLLSVTTCLKHISICSKLIKLHSDTSDTSCNAYVVGLRLGFDWQLGLLDSLTHY